MLIDDFLPTYDVSDSYRTDIDAPAERVYAALRSFDLGNSPLSRLLFGLRGLPALLSPNSEPEGTPGLTLEGLLQGGFILLAENPPHELAMGLIGQFWRATAEVVADVDASGFRDFDLPGYARTALNFSLVQQSDGVTRLATETRVCCPDEASRKKFRLYWTLIGPFSGLIRKEMLRLIEREALLARSPIV